MRYRVRSAPRRDRESRRIVGVRVCPRGRLDRRAIGNEAAIASLIVELFLDAYRQPPKQIILDLEATDDPLHGQEERRFFHGDYNCYC